MLKGELKMFGGGGRGGKWSACVDFDVEFLPLGLYEVSVLYFFSLFFLELELSFFFIFLSLFIIHIDKLMRG